MTVIDLTTMLADESLNLGAFEQKTGIHTTHQRYDFVSGWNQILQIALNQGGPDVSQIGSTWQETLANTLSLHAFTPAEMNALGGESAFLSLHRIEEKGAQEIFSIPWLLDTRMVHYRADALQKAGIPEREAFATPEAMVDTLTRLQAAGVPYPLVMSNGSSAMQILASFVWGRGGDFRSPDLRKMTLLEPEARRGLLDYFGMHKFINPKKMSNDTIEMDDDYYSGKAMVAFSGQWVMQTIKLIAQKIPEVSQNTHLAPPPGVPYIGGSYLVLWQHSRNKEAALQLIQYLTSPEVMSHLTTTASIIPARKEVFERAPLANDPDYQLTIRLIQQGRRYRSGKMWAGVEARLAAFTVQLWQDLASNPDMNLEDEIERRVSDLTARIERSLLIAG